MTQVPQQTRDDPPLADSHGDRQESIPHLVVRTVATVEGVPVDALPPLNDAVDTDALSSLFGSGSAVDRLAFSYQGYRVVVSSGKRVTVYD